MNIRIRNIIRKIKPLYNFGQRMLLLECWLFYCKHNRRTDNKARITRLKDSQLGKSCFIVGNGPSLTMDDLELIKEHDCFAANLIFKIFDKTEWRPKYYFVIDRYADTGNVLNDIQLQHLFIGDYYWKYRGMNNPNAICLHTRRGIGNEKIKFSENVEKVVYCNYTVTHAMIQLAAYMGYKNIYLLGMDHSYALTYDHTGKVIENKSVQSHVFKDNNPKDVIANIEGMNKAYIASKEYAINNDIRIINVTRGGKLEWFERAKLEDALKDL